MNNAERTAKLALMVSRYMRSPEVLAEMGVDEDVVASKLNYAAVMIAATIRLAATFAAATYDAEDKINKRDYKVADRTKKIQPTMEKMIKIIKEMENPCTR